MNRSAALEMIRIQEQALEDEEYQLLLQEYRRRSTELARILQSIPDRERDVLEDYLGLAAEMHRKLLEIACK